MSNCTDFGCLWYSNNYKKDTSLKDVLGDKFLIGVALNTRCRYSFCKNSEAAL